ncbi:MAG: IS4 family transposase [Desulfobacterales bacterium]|nr:IS4 family transposase [Desulfobacterales bacterium]
MPKNKQPESKKKKKDFTRNRKLPFQKIFTYVLSITADNKSDGVDIKSNAFFKAARRSGIWPNAETVHRSAITKARKKIDWKIFEEVFYKASKLAYELWPKDPQYLWKGMSVFAVDGSKYTLPATKSLRKEFDPESGLQKRGKGHFPQCLVSTVYDVFRRFPVARTIVDTNGSEREEIMKLLPKLPSDGILMFDRGYPSFELIKYLSERYKGYFLFRCKSKSTFRQVEEFVAGKESQETIHLAPCGRYFRNLPKKEKDNLKSIPLRIIRLQAPDGTVSVLLTNLEDNKKFPKTEIEALYFKRWEVESYYRDEKVYLELERFHSRTSNGIRQELFAAIIMSVVTRVFMAVSMQEMEGKEPQFKNALRTLSVDAAILTYENPAKMIEVFEEILADIRKVKYYRPKKPRKPQPRVTKKTVKKWSVLKKQKATRS